MIELVFCDVQACVRVHDIYLRVGGGFSYGCMKHEWLYVNNMTLMSVPLYTKQFLNIHLFMLKILVFCVRLVVYVV